jgi:hypothetical protein
MLTTNSLRWIVFSMFSALALIVAVSLFVSLRDRSRAGKLHRNLGYTWMHGVFLAISALFAILIIGMLMNLSAEPWMPGIVVVIIALVLISLYTLLYAIAPLQVMEHGILWGGLTRWEKIVSFHWKNQRTLVLYIWPFKNHKSFLIIPAKHKEYLEDILSQRVTGAS